MIELDKIMFSPTSLSLGGVLFTSVAIPPVGLMRPAVYVTMLIRPRGGLGSLVHIRRFLNEKSGLLRENASSPLIGLLMDIFQLSSRLRGVPPASRRVEHTKKITRQILTNCQPSGVSGSGKLGPH